VHVLFVGAIVVGAVGNELAIAHPHGRLDLSNTLVMAGAPVAYLLGNGLYKRVVYGRFPVSHALGVLASLMLALAAPMLDLLTMNALTTVVVLAVGGWDHLRARPVGATA
jgi:low temperature requirement protein LtrA